MSASRNRSFSIRRRTMSKVILDVVSFGTAYQYDLTEYWVRPAADKCGYGLVEYSIYDPGIRTFEILGKGYPPWVEDIRSGKNKWDLRHCLDEAAFVPGGDEVFAEFPERRITGLPDHLQFPRCLPPIQFCYVLTWRRDLLGSKIVPDWETFFDIKRVPGKRAVRDLPHGMIEVALHALGRDVKEELYDPTLSKEQIRGQVDDALAMFDRLGTDIHWWGGSYQMHEALVNGEIVMGAAWNRRVMRASQALQPGVSYGDALIQANAKTAMLLCDWWLIPKGTGNEEHANRLLECMYTDKDILKSAARWCVSQSNLIPTEYMPIEDEFTRYHLEMGSWKNPDYVLDINPQFWGKNYTWIAEYWKRWLTSKKNMR